MRTGKRFLISWILFLFCIVVPSPSLAQDNLPMLVKRIQPAVVTIYTEEGQGSGFFISKKGYLITNYHVLEGADSAEVKTHDGKVYAIRRVLAKDINRDLILVSVDIPENSVHYLQIASTPPEAGESVVVVGSPEGLEQTVSNGIVSAIRYILGLGKVIQITAPISPGSSGSPVVNRKGEVIGVATLQMVEGQNLNFARPLADWTEARAFLVKDFEGRTESRVRERVKENTSGGDQNTFLPYPPPPPGTITPQWWVGRGEDNIEAGRYQEAVDAFKRAIRLRPDFAYAYYGLGVAYNSLGRHQEAVEALKKHNRLMPNYAYAHYMLGLAYENLGRWQEAVEACNQAIRLKPDYAEAYNNLGVAYGNLGRHQEEIDACKQAIRLKPDFAEAHYNMGVAYGNLGRYQEEIAAYKEAIRLKPDYADAHNDLGVAYGNLGRWQEAVDAFKQTIRLKSDDPETQHNLGVAYANLGRYQEAVEAYKQAIRLKSDDADAHYNLGVAYGNLGRHQEAIDAYKQAIRIKPDYADAHSNLGVAYANLGRHQEAIKAYKEAIRLKPDYAEAYYNLGTAYGNLGRYQEEIDAYKQAIRLKPDYAEAHHNLGVAYGNLQGHPDISNVNVEEEVKAAVEYGKEHQDYDSQLKVGAYLYVEARRVADAKPYFLKAHELKPQEFEPLMQLGNLCFDMGQETNNSKLMEEAADWYGKALKIKPDDINVRTDLGITYLLRQPSDPKAALAEFEKSLALEPKHVPTLYNKARALISLKDFKAAEETFALLKKTNPQPELINTLRKELDKAKRGDTVLIPTH